MKRFSSLLLVAVVALGLTLTGCDSTDSSSGTADVTMEDGTTKTTSKSHVTSNLKEALVTVTKVSVSPENDGDPKALSDEEVDVDLVKLKSGEQISLSDLSIPTGTYEQIRLSTTGDVAITFDDDSQNTARLASSVLKLNFQNPFTIESPDDKVDVTVDWDVESSLEGTSGNDLDLTQSNLVITPVVQAEATVTSATDDGNSN